MDWLLAVPTVALCVVAFWGPGVLLGLAGGLRGLPVLAVAPAAGAGLLGAASILAAACGVGWTGGVAVLVTAACIVPVVVAHRVRSAASAPSERVPRAPTAVLGAAIVLGVLGQLVPVVLAMGRPDRVLNAWDALFHLSAVQTGRADGLVTPASLARLAAPDEARVELYPHAWHAVTALLPQWSGAMVTVNAAAIVPVVVATVVGVAGVVRAVFPCSPLVPPSSAVLAASGLAVPLAIALQPGLIPNAFALSMVPGVLACMIVAHRRRAGTWIVLVCAAAGVALVHPNAGLALAVLGLPWVLPMLARPVRRVASGWTGRIAIAIASAGGLAALGLLVASPTAQEVAATQQKPPQSFVGLVTGLATGDLGEWPTYAIVPTLLAVLGAVVVVRRKRGRALVVALLLAVALYASAASPVDAISSVTRLWYTETRRLAPLVGMLCVPLAAFGTVWLARVAVQRVDVPRRMSRTAARQTLGVVLVGLAVGLGPVQLGALADDSFSQDVPDAPQAFDRVPYLTIAEEGMIATVAERSDKDALLLGSSFSGAGHLAALTGQRVNQPYHTTQLGPEALYVSGHLDELGVDPLVCENVRALQARSVYVDPYPLHSTYWTFAAPGSFVTPPREGVVVARAGDAAIYSLDICY